MTRCYNPESCVHIHNCSSWDKYTCDPDTDIHLYLLDRFFEPFDGRFCKGVTCCPVVPCGELPETMTPTPLFQWNDSTQNMKDYVVLMGIIPVSVILLVILLMVCFQPGTQSIPIRRK